MNALAVLCAVACFAGVRAGAIHVVDTGPSNSSASTDSSSEDRLKEMRIEMVKLQILSKLNIKKPPPALALPSETTKEALGILLQEAESRDQWVPPLASGERLVIHAKNNGVKCSQPDSNSCRVFHFDLAADLNSSSVDLWIFVKDESSSEVLSVSASYSTAKDESKGQKYFRKVEKPGWNKVELPKIVLPPASTGSLRCTLELFGPVVANHDERRPFLLVNKPTSVAIRKRRDVSCDSNENCCWKHLSVSLAEIGFTWVLYPVQLEVNMCTGKCRMDHSEMKTHYERAMTKVLEKDSSLHDHLGMCWTLCCKPKQMDPVRVIYNDTEGIIHDQYIPELTVKSCSCS